MKVQLAKTAGFCFGVKRAVETVYEQLQNAGENQVYTYGPIIHNEEVVKDIQSRGGLILHSEADFKEAGPGVVVIRSHGIPKTTLDRLCEEKTTDGKPKFLVVDATCPFVKKIHRIVQEQSELGNQILIIGDDKHPEVKGIIGWSKTPVFVADSEEKLQKLDISAEKRLCIVAQTTFNYKKFQDLVEIIEKKGYDILVVNTICNATEERQAEAVALARQSDAMIVIGGKQSSNTRKLFELSKNECENTYYIQTLGDLDLAQLKSFRSVGITAGASTPNNIIKEVHTACQK